MIPISILLILADGSPATIDYLQIILTVAGSVIASMGSVYGWMRAKFAATDIHITNIQRWQDRHIESMQRESAVMGRELMQMRQEANDNYKEMVKLITDIRLHCAAHDESMRNIQDKLKD